MSRSLKCWARERDWLMRSKIIYLLAILSLIASAYLLFGIEGLDYQSLDNQSGAQDVVEQKKEDLLSSSALPMLDKAEPYLRAKSEELTSRLFEQGDFPAPSQSSEMPVSLNVEKSNADTTVFEVLPGPLFQNSERSIYNPNLSRLESTEEVLDKKNRRVTQEAGGKRAPNLLFEGEQSGATAQSEDQQEALPRVGGQSRGYVLLYAMQPEARATVERQVEGMLASNVRDLFIAVLSDGTFSRDFAYLKTIMQRLSDDDRRLTLLLYLTNGSSMREYDVTEISAGFNQINPDEFRELIRFDPSTRQQFLEMVAEVKPIFEFNISLGSSNRNLASVMLEDNLDNVSYSSMRNLARSVLGNLVEYVRNPCPGCFAGNEWDPSGDLLELHSVDALHALRRGDGFTTDGESYYYEGALPNGLSMEELKFFKAQSIEQGLSYFALWKRERQGLYDDTRPHPSRRIYQIPSSLQIKKDIDLLRYGLSEVD